MKGIDVSKWNGIIDWRKVINDNVDFAIIKAITKNGIDPLFETNYANAKAENIPLGVYNYSYATSLNQARNDAARLIGCIIGKELPFKIWLDVEDDCQKNLGQKLIDIIKAYKEVIELAGVS